MNAKRKRINTHYKLIVLDIDGTLINKDGKISDLDRSAIKRAKHSGLTISLCTGRTTGASLKILRDLGLEGAHIFFDGTLVYDPLQDIEIYSRPIALHIVEEMIDFSHNTGLPLDLFSRTQYFTREESWRTELRKKFFGIQAIITDLRSILKNEHIIKGGIAVRTPEEIELARQFASSFSDRINVTWTLTPAFPDIQFINLLRKGTSKGLALKALCTYLKIPLVQVCAIGDGENDISLISTAGLGIAMQNSTPELISKAKYVTSDVEHCGVAKAIEKFIFLE